MVTSLPSRAMRALPKGMVYSSSGTSPSMLKSILCSRKITGLSLRMAVLSRPLPSAAEEGVTTCKPGVWANQASRQSVWWAACIFKMPSPQRMTRWTFPWPPNM